MKLSRYKACFNYKISYIKDHKDYLVIAYGFLYKEHCERRNCCIVMFEFPQHCGGLSPWLVFSKVVGLNNVIYLDILSFSTVSDHKTYISV